MEDFGSACQLVTLGLVDSSKGSMTKRVSLVNLKILVLKTGFLSSNVNNYFMCHSSKYMNYTEYETIDIY